MKLTVFRSDVQEQFSKLPCYDIYFEHFKPQVQKVIMAVGEALFSDETSFYYCLILPQLESPKKE